MSECCIDYMDMDRLDDEEKKGTVQEGKAIQVIRERNGTQKTGEDALQGILPESGKAHPQLYSLQRKGKDSSGTGQ